jgi:GH35 family endo-1,4-beta-xylanase
VSGSGETQLRLTRGIDATTFELVASSPAATAPRDYDDFASQISQEIYLTAGQEYGIEVLQKNVGDSVDDHFAVAWTKPSDVPGTWEVVPTSAIRPVLAKVTISAEVSEANEWDLVGEDLVFAFTRNDDLGQSLNVVYTIGGTADNGVDYDPIGQSIVIPAGQRTARLNVTPRTDNPIEGPETVTLRLVDIGLNGGINAAYWMGSESETAATGTIRGEYSDGNGGSIPVGGTSLLPAAAVDLANISWTAQAPATTDPTVYTNEPIDDVAVPFTQILAADVGTADQVWHARPVWDLSQGINEFDTVLAVGWMRSANPDGSAAKAAFRFTEISTTLGQGSSFDVGPQWRKYWFTFSSARTIAPGDARFDVRFGFPETDAIEIGGVQLINYGALIDSQTVAQTLRANDAIVDDFVTPAQNFSPDSVFTDFSVSNPALPFTMATRVDVNSFVNPWDVRRNWPVALPVAQGDQLFARFFARSANADGSPATFDARFELGASPFTGVQQEYSVGSQWQEFLFPFEALIDFAQNASQFNLRFGYGDQVVEVGGVELYNHGRDYAADLLPQPIYSYGGREADSLWRESAETAAEIARNDSLGLTVYGPDGTPAHGASVELIPLNTEYKFGTAVNYDWVAPTAGTQAASADGVRYQSIIPQLFTRATDENAQQWSSWVTDPNRATEVLAWALANDLTVHGHAILWGELDGFPTPDSVIATYNDKLVNEGAAAAEAYLEAEIVAFIASGPASTFVGNVSGSGQPQISEWDVLNHPALVTDIWDVTGQDFLLSAINAARGVTNADTEFFVNEDRVLSRESGGLDDAYYQLIETLLAAAAPIDGIGFQGHFHSEQLPSLETVVGDLARFESFGLAMQVTELDVDANHIDHQTQADFTRDLLLALESNANLQATTFWGFWENEHWRSGEDAASFAADWSVKPNGQVLLDYLRVDPHKLETSSSGQVLATLPRGDYQATVVDAAGNRITAVVSVVSGGTLAEITLPAAPTDIGLSSSAMNENVDTSAADVLFGDLAAVDDTPNDTHSFQLAPGVGDDDNAKFTIDGARLMIRQGQVLDAESQDAYSVRVRVTDSTGQWVEKQLALTVNNLVEVADSDIQIDDGSGQRSRIDALTVTFDSEVAIAPDAFSVTRRGGGPVAINFTTALNNGRTVATLTMSGVLVQNGSLVDGNYDLTIDAAKVTSVASGFGMDANGDGVVGDDFVFGDAAADNFYRLYGDDDGNGSVNLFDFAAFRSAFGATLGSPGYLGHFDATDDGSIDLFDFAVFRSAFGKSRVFE